MNLTYKNSGVNYSLMDPFKNTALKLGGNSSQLTEFPNFYLVDVLEAVGSLNKLAEDIYQKSNQDFYYQVGWGNGASILNDLAVFGAKVKTCKLFLAAGSEDFFKDRQHWQKLLSGFAGATKFSGASWNGGETQTLKDIVNPKSLVLAGSATGIIQPKNQLLTEEKIATGDRIILLASSGLHTNGITLVRKIFKDDLKLQLAAIKNKTTIYLPLVNELLKQGLKIHYASHITGHGWRKIMRSKRKLTYIIEKMPKPQPIFKKIQQKTQMSNSQIYGDYNMGAGFVLFASAKEVNKILSLASKMSIKALDAGFVTKGPRKVIIKPIGIEFTDNTLNIR